MARETTKKEEMEEFFERISLRFSNYLLLLSIIFFRIKSSDDENGRKEDASSTFKSFDLSLKERSFHQCFRDASYILLFEEMLLPSIQVPSFQVEEETRRNLSLQL